MVTIFIQRHIQYHLKKLLFGKIIKISSRIPDFLLEYKCKRDGVLKRIQKIKASKYNQRKTFKRKWAKQPGGVMLCGLRYEGFIITES